MSARHPAVPAPATAWHAMSVEAACARLACDPRGGLAPSDAADRLRDLGPNVVPTAPERTRLRILLDQYLNLLTAVLAAAAVVSWVAGQATDGIVIAAILVLNGGLGYFQERKAAMALSALRAMTAPSARVRRAAVTAVVPAADLVPGDVVVLEAGDRVPADLRLVEAHDFETVEAALTGESEPTHKSVAAVGDDAGLHARFSMAYLGTHVAAGQADGVVVATAGGTELGRIAQLVREAREEETPLQTQLRVLGRRLIVASALLVAAVFALGLARGLPPLDMFLSAVGLAVAAIPEGLPAVITIALALGVTRMARRHAIVRRLPAVEALGCTTVLCADKTGTLTLGLMRLTETTTLAGTVPFVVSDPGVAASASGDSARVPDTGPERLALVCAAVACCTARPVEVAGRLEVAGDPTERAIILAGLELGVTVEELDRTSPVESVAPFDAARRRMSILRRSDAGLHLYVKGALESLLEISTTVGEGGRARVIGPTERKRFDDFQREAAGRGLRVLAVAVRAVVEPGTHSKFDARALECDLTLLGLLGIEDPPRPEARVAVAACRAAGIRPVMITGDQPATALAVARALGIAAEESEVSTGAKIAAMSDDALANAVPTLSVYARTSPEQKLRIVLAWKARGEVVAMTGDGVNDAPALKAADIGVAVGPDATEVAKEASDVVVTDGNFATLVAAVEEGRGIYDNIRKSLLYLLSGNCGEILLVALTLLVGMPMPLLPIQLLWINLLTDGLPALALATDPPDPDLLSRPPRATGRRMADSGFLGAMLGTGLLVGGVGFLAFVYGLRVENSLERARTYAFAVVVTAEALRALGARSTTRFVWETGLRSNLRLVAAVALALGVQLAGHHFEALQGVLGTGPLGFSHCGFILLLGAVPLAVLELLKGVRRLSRTHPTRATSATGDSRG